VSRKPIISVRSLTKRFASVLALDRVDFDIEAGEVHALVGENGAGKSTLINLLAGELQPDTGEIFYQTEELRIRDPHHAQKLGISVVYQELALCPNLSAAQNISLHCAAGAPFWAPLNRARLRNEAIDGLRRMGLSGIDLDVPVRKLTLAQQQLVEIAKALATNVRVLILDEPNSALTFEESKYLFRVINQLRQEQVAILYVSHRLEEVLELADRITVMRDGQVIDCRPAADFSVPELIRKMVGREVAHLYHRQTPGHPSKRPVLSVRNLTETSLLRNVSFDVHQGEMLGIAGLPGSGKEELVECLCGLRRFTGQICVKEKRVKFGSPEKVINLGIGVIPADRRGSGLFSVLTITDNMVAANLSLVSSLGVLSKRRMLTVVQEYLPRLGIRAHSEKQRAGTLSGGNQQKVILARGLARQPHLLLLHEPTRGIDVGAKAEIYEILGNLAASGLSILIVSSELPELIGQCDRILAMYTGRITGEFDRTDATEERILASAMGDPLANSH
jgi:ABC-type sugar transport system ATPase subunit